MKLLIMELMKMINLIISIIKVIYEELIKFFNLETLWIEPIRKEQSLYRRKSGHILNRYDSDNWKEDYLW